MLKKLIPIISFLILLSSSASAEWVQKDYVTFFGPTNQTVTVAWNPSAEANYYELELNQVEQNTKTILPTGQSLTDTQKTFSLPKTGHFIIRVRACNSAISQCSSWASSTDATVSMVGSDSRAWWIYGYVAPPGPIVIH